MGKPGSFLGHWNENGTPRTADVLRFFRVTQVELDVWFKTAAPLSKSGELLAQEESARTKVFNIYILLTSRSEVRFITEGVARNYYDTHEVEFSCGRVTTKAAMDRGLLDEVIEKLKAMEVLK